MTFSNSLHPAAIPTPEIQTNPISATAFVTPASQITLHRRSFNQRLHFPLSLFPLWQIQTGLVRSYTFQEDGNLITLGLWGSGDIVGSLFSRNPTYTVECLTFVEATPIPVSALSNFTEILVGHLQQMHDVAEILHAHRVDIALIRFLNWLALKFGQNVPEGQIINIPLTHQVIADTMGVSRVTITRLLNQFEQEDIIKRLPRRLILLQDPQPSWYYQI